MKRGILLITGFGIFAFLSAGAVVRGNTRGNDISVTKRVTIDGNSFSRDEFPAGDVSLLRRELRKLGVEIPDEYFEPEEPRSSHPVFSGRIAPSTSRVESVGTSRLPQGMKAEHSIEMEGDGHPVELVFGKLSSRGSTVRSGLSATGWIPVAGQGDSRSFRMLQTGRGKETAVVCLDEAEGTFLLLREVGR